MLIAVYTYAFIDVFSDQEENDDDDDDGEMYEDLDERWWENVPH